MTRTTALLILGAILTIVAYLFGEDGTMTRVAGMDRSELQETIDRAAPPPSTGSWASRPDPADAEVVRPVVVGDGDDIAIDVDVTDDLPDQDGTDELADSSDKRPEDVSDAPFDPRIG